MARIGGAPLPTITDDRALGSADIQRSLRFSRLDSAYLSRALGSPTSDDKASVSVWLKRTDISTDNSFFDNYQGTNDRLSISLVSSTDGDALSVYQRDSSGIVCNLLTTQKFRDPDSWYHLLIAFDTTQSTAADRVKIYVNGTQVTSFSSSTYFSQNHNLRAGSGYTTNIGRYGAGSNYFGGYMAEFNYIDGQQLSPTDVGFTDSQTGIWMPKRYEGSYGNNGFRLDFSDNSSTAALGIDKSPNGNDLSVQNLDVGAGVGNDSVIDTPTNTFPTLSKLYGPVNTTFGEGNLLMRGGDNFAASTFLLPKSGKWYAEFTKYNNGAIQSISVTRANTAQTNYAGYLGLADNVEYVSNGEVGNRTRGSNSDAPAWTDEAGVVVAVAVDMDNGAVYFAKNNTYINSGVPTSGSAKTGAIATDLLTDNTGDHLIAVHGYNANNSYGMYANFGQRPFTYTPPAGYKSLCTKNLPPNVPSLVRPQKFFDSVIYTGNGSTGQSITSFEFQPDFIWFKRRDGTNWNAWFDSVRGRAKGLASNKTNTEYTSGSTQDLISFDISGFTLGSTYAWGSVNGNTFSNVAWCWKAGGNSNTYNIDGKGYATAAAAGLDGGTIDPTGSSINTESGFSISTYTGNGTAGATIAHGLGKKPAWIVIKARDVGDKWFVYHHRAADIAGAADGHVYAELQETAAFVNYPNMLNDTAPTDTLVTLHSDRAVNGNGYSYVMYSWAEIPGYSKFGSYTGNGSNDGRFIYTGFRPAFVLLKSTNLNVGWYILDNKRDPVNFVSRYLRADADNDEDNDEFVDFLSKGFKQRYSDTAGNGSGDSYVYFAFAEQPGTTPFDTYPNAR